MGDILDRSTRLQQIATDPKRRVATTCRRQLHCYPARLSPYTVWTNRAVERRTGLDGYKISLLT